MKRIIGAITGMGMLFAAQNAAALVLSDTEFFNADWTTTAVFLNNGASTTVTRSTSGGDGGAYRHMTHFIANGPGQTRIFQFHRYGGGSYDPTATGAIGSIDYAESQLQLNPPFPGAAIGARLAIEQDGVVYMAPGMTYTHSGAGNWVDAAMTGLTATDFIDPLQLTALGGPGGAANPDFSASGSEIFFGYMRVNCCGGDITTTHGIDNWSVTVNTAIEIAEPGLGVLFGAGFICLQLVRRKRAV